MQRSILLVEDEAALRRTLAEYFQREGWFVLQAGDGKEGIESYEQHRPDVVLCDVKLPELSGLNVLHVIRQRDPDATVVMLTAYGDIPTAVEAMHLGAENFLTKPADLTHLKNAVMRAAEKTELRRRSRFLAERQVESNPATLGKSVQMQRIAEQMRVLAEGDAPVLLLGESGTGKGRVAQLIHAMSPRASAPFVDLNCATLSATFLQSELFGHEKGAFTDARNMKRGLFEVAHTGSLFLDEIGDLASELQPSLLKVLETGRFRRMGGTVELHSDVRLVAATNRDLDEAVREKRFREDLFYRLNVLPLRLPPLRERGRSEITDLALGVLAELCQRDSRTPMRISAEALDLMLKYHWPGNIRQLRNVLERVLLIAGNATEVLPQHLPPELHASGPDESGSPDGIMPLAEVERRHIARVLERCDGNRAAAARALGIARVTLYKRMREYGIE